MRIQACLIFVLALATSTPAGCSTRAQEEAKPTAKQQENQKQEHKHAHKYTNELTKESSPYLLMHAHNPVNWHAWNDATLAKAKKEDKPIFLSIGYSSCHWCHVMERESFYDEEIAKFLNENFICIKVDREERPDVDEIYMQALMEIRRGGGGWPLSMFMNPEAKPFYGGTYWPARDGDRGARMGFLTIVNKVHEHFRDNRDAIEKDATVVTERTKVALAGLEPKEGLPVQKSWSGTAVKNLAADFDSRFGGFGYSASDSQRPKFPQPANLFFLFDKVQRASDQNDPDVVKAKEMLIKTCERMMMGGIYDHLGGGFHRYSVDRFWKIPHFEKMLYDNGQLATVYAEVYKMTGREEFKNVVDGILAFVDRELVAENGGIYSSLDAESEGEEGKFYRWELEEIKKALKPEDYKLFASVYGLNNPPNFEEEYYAPQLGIQMAEVAKSKSMTLNELEAKLTPMRKILFEIRAERIRPLLDHKILTAWNGLMIRGYADAGRALKNEHYIKTGERAAKFALENLRDDKGRLFRTYTDKEAKLNGYLIDYACLIEGLIALHKATGKQEWLDAAKSLQQTQDELFWDEKSGGYFYTSKDHEVLLARSKRIYDNAMPCGNCVASENLFYLGKHLNDKSFTEKSHKTVLAASSVMTRAPHAAPRMLIAAEEFVK